MKIETRLLPDNHHFELTVNDKYWDTFESIQELADAVTKLLVFGHDPMTADFIEALAQSEVKHS